MRKISAVLTLLLVAGALLGHSQGQTAHAGNAESEEAANGAPMARQLADLTAAAKVVGEVPALENDYVRVNYVLLEYPAAERRVAERCEAQGVTLERLRRSL